MSVFIATFVAFIAGGLVSQSQGVSVAVGLAMWLGVCVWAGLQ